MKKHAENGASKVGFLALFFDLYLSGGDSLFNSSRQFGDHVAELLREDAEVVYPGVCINRQAIESAVSLFEAEKVDLIIITHLTYAPSMYAVPSLRTTQLPVLLYHTQKLKKITSAIVPWDLEENHGVHGMQDLASVLRRIGRPYFVVAGEDQAARKELHEWIAAARLRRALSESSVGIIGHPMENMGDFGVDETNFESQIGVHVKHLSMKSLADEAQKAPADEIEAQMAFDRRHFICMESVTLDRHESAARLEWALRATIEREKLLGFASHFLTIIQEGLLDTLPFLAASKLLGEGYGFGGEGDVTSAVAVGILNHMAGEANFTEIFSVDYEGGAIFMSHMGEGNWRLAREDAPILMRSDPFDIGDLKVDPVSLVFSLRPGPATLLNITTGANGRIQWIVAEGEVVDSPPFPNLTQVHNRFVPQLLVADFLIQYSEQGGSHHLAMAYGNWKSALWKLARIMNVQFVEI